MKRTINYQNKIVINRFVKSFLKNKKQKKNFNDTFLFFFLDFKCRVICYKSVDTILIDRTPIVSFV